MEEHIQSTSHHLDFRFALKDLPQEHGFVPLRVEGQIPPALSGTLFRNGPGVFSVAGTDVHHWFDGPGVVSAVRFVNGRAEGACRVVVSPDLQRERQAGKPLYGGMGAAGVGLRRFRVAPRNVANTNLLSWDGRLFALFEAGVPVEVCPEDLSTIGETDLDGVVPMWFSAHHHRVAARQTTYNFGLRIGMRAHLDLFALPDRGKARLMGSVPLNGIPFLHDFIATQTHLIFFVPPVRVDTWRQVLGMRTFQENLRWRPDLGTEVIVVSIDDPKEVTRFTIDPFYQWHFSNAFTQTDGTIAVDLIRYDDADSIHWLGDLFTGAPTGTVTGTLSRAVLNVSKKTVQIRPLWDGSCEFPMIHPEFSGSDAKIVWLSAHTEGGAHPGYSDCMARVDISGGNKTLRFGDGPGTFPSEPAFVPRPDATNEGDGWVISLMYSTAAHASYAAIWDSRTLQAGPVARAWFAHHVPIPLHGCWVGGED